MPAPSARRRSLVLAAAIAAAVAGAASVSARLARSPSPRPARLAQAAVAWPRAPRRAPEILRVTPPVQAAAAAPAPAVPLAAKPPRPGCQIVFRDAAPRPGALGEIARALIAEHRDELGLAAMPGELAVKREFGSKGGWHLRYEQRVQGVPVWCSEVSAHVAPDGRPLLLNADVYRVEGVETTPAVTSDASRAVAADFLVNDGLSDDGLAVESAAPRLVILPQGRSGRLAWVVDARTPDESARVFVDAKTSAVLRTDDLRRAADGAAQVFIPNPVHSRRDPSLRDFSNADTATLTAARVPVTLHHLDGSGYLRGTWADLTLTRSPSVSASLDWTSVTRSNAAFEQVMAYYHIDTAQQRLRDLGLTNVNARPMPADAHAFRDDNSYYDGFDRALHFGDGGVDDAEDGDVIHHEYGHAMQDDQVTDFGQTAEGGAMGEGFGDFHAVSFHDANDATYDPAFACWDGVAFSFLNPPAVRRVDGRKVYPRDVVGEVHDDGEIWSRFLWDLRKQIGNDTSLEVVVESHFLLTANAKFLHGANAILAANRSLRAGADEASIEALLAARGLAYTVAPPPGADDAFEPNDDLAHAAPLATGSHAGLVLADEDWYELSVPPGRRLHVTPAFDAATLDLQAELRTTSGAIVQTADPFSPSIDASAGPDGATFALRIHPADVLAAAGAYQLDVTGASLATLRSGRTTLVPLASGARAVYSVHVGAAAARRPARLRVVAKSRGGVADLRITSPSGRVAAEFGLHRTLIGSTASVRADEAGDWIVEIEPRDGTSGDCAVKARVE